MQPEATETRTDAFVPTARTTLKRLAGRGDYDRATVHAILDEGLVCHVAFAVDGQPFMIPTAYARIGDALYVHGSTANRTFRALADGAEACITVTLLDGLVLARSAFHHSVNYRCVVMFGIGQKVTDPDEHMRALEAMVEHVVPGRWKDVRWPNREESLRTLVVRFPITEASAKVRTGNPIDDEEDHALDVWAGVIPLQLQPGVPQADPRTPAEKAAPAYATAYVRPGR
ncbi:MAG TPA: pyridoxamine 5'-phosphate oxidase family protein [Candidatus Limnocylindrales bacterium]|nr:pyridoxamine 5'-phosphate oxidase family protein [Candidatus Limnocylindrales bacterium]